MVEVQEHEGVLARPVEDLPRAFLEAVAVGHARERVRRRSFRQNPRTQRQFQLFGLHEPDARRQGHGQADHLGQDAHLQGIAEEEGGVVQAPGDNHGEADGDEERADREHVPECRRIARAPAAEADPDHEQGADEGDELGAAMGKAGKARDPQRRVDQGPRDRQLQGDVDPRRAPGEVEESPGEQGAEGQPQRGRHLVAVLDKPGIGGPEIVRGMTVEGGQGQQGEGAGDHVVAVGTVAENGGEGEVVDEQGQEHAVADTVEEPLVRALVLVVAQVPGDRCDGMGEICLYTGVGAVFPGFEGAQGHDGALAAQRAGRVGRAQAAVHRCSQCLTVGVEGAVEVHRAQRRGRQLEEQGAAGFRDPEVHAEPERLAALGAQRLVRIGPGDRAAQDRVKRCIARDGDGTGQRQALGTWVQADRRPRRSGQERQQGEQHEQAGVSPAMRLHCTVTSTGIQRLMI